MQFLIFVQILSVLQKSPDLISRADSKNNKKASFFETGFCQFHRKCLFRRQPLNSVGEISLKMSQIWSVAMH